ncbi:alanine/glycine:cation symporter family protein [Streptomyces sp. NPDC001941]|uniref:alanine/glycine:cation symporter family protein n=1 Tax=Streptomyces sp. NPDC001941 TaxID=3154659 RepID=UPI0033217775
MPVSSSPVALAAGGVVSGIEDAVNQFVQPLTDAVSKVIFFEVPIGGVGVPLIVAWLLVGGIVFTVYLGAVQIRGLRLAYEITRRRGSGEDADAPGEVTQFQALMAACAGTVGLGNIAGVAVAVSVGGPGATFWMIVCGLLGMALKFAECTLGVKYREVNEDGTVSGGPMHYLRRGLADRGFARLGRVLAVAFAPIIIVFGLTGGNMFQVNQTVAQLRSVTGGDSGVLGGSAAGLGIGVVIAVLIGVILLGGAKRLGAVVGRLVPLMAVVYLIGCVIVLAVNASALPGAFQLIVREAFDPAAGAGGVIGVMVVGFTRAAFSNEAGLGSAPIVQAAAKTRHPASGGLVSMLGPLIDTVIVCTMTALAIIVANPPEYAAARAAGRAEGVELTSAAFASVLPWFPYVLTVAVVLFALSTTVTWSYYGQKCWEGVFGAGGRSDLAFKLVTIGCVVLGSVLTLGAVLDLADALLFVLALINIFGLYLMAPTVKQELKDYLRHRATRGGQDGPDAQELVAVPEAAGRQG